MTAPTQHQGATPRTGDEMRHTRGTSVLLKRLHALMQAEMTSAGHAGLRVNWEHLGECRPGRCTDRCVEKRALLDWIERRLGLSRHAAGGGAG